MRPGQRPATAEEARADRAKRRAAIAEAEAAGTHSPRQLTESRAVLDTFTGYPRDTR